MKKTHLILLIFLALGFSVSGANAAPREAKISASEELFFPTRVNTMLGMCVSQGASLLSGMQLGHAPFTGTPLYFGPEFTFALYSPGSLFSVAAGGWYDFPIYGTPHLTLSLGAVVGGAIASDLPQFPSTSLIGFLDVSLSQELDDLTSVRAQFRPGIIHHSVAYMMNFSLSFRFR